MLTKSPEAAEPETHVGSSRFRRWGTRAVPWLLTGTAVVISAILGHKAWRRYVEAPWTRDGTVRAYVVTIASEVSGRIVELRVSDNQSVHEGDLLMTIDPTDYQIAVRRTTAALQQAMDAQNLLLEAQRRERLAYATVARPPPKYLQTSEQAARAYADQLMFAGKSSP